MRKVDDGEKKKKKIMTFIVATTSLPVDRPNAERLERRTLVPIKIQKREQKVGLYFYLLAYKYLTHLLILKLLPFSLL